MADQTPYHLFCIFIAMVPEAPKGHAIKVVSSTTGGSTPADLISEWWEQWQVLRRELRLAGVVRG